MAGLSDISNGDYGKIGIITFRAIMTGCVGLLVFFGSQLYSKTDAAVDKTTFDKASTALWEAQAKANSALNQLTTNLSTLQVQFTDHVRDDLDVVNTQKDHEQRLRSLESKH